VLVAMMALYAWTLGFASEGEARATAFATLVAGNLGLILGNRSRNLTMLGSLRRPNRALWWIVAASLTALAATLYVPAVAALFRFEPIGPGLLGCAGAAGLASVLWYDAYKIARPRG
jgi:P-type Ca2+ transporter type 2C